MTKLICAFRDDVNACIKRMWISKEATVSEDFSLLLSCVGGSI